MMGIAENKVETYLKEEVQKLGGISRKWVSPNHVGVPDRIVIIQGIVAFVEVKTLTGKLSKPQEREIKRLIAHEANVFVVNGKKGVDEFINAMKGALENVNNDTGNTERVLR